MSHQNLLKSIGGEGWLLLRRIDDLIKMAFQTNQTESNNNTVEVNIFTLKILQEGISIAKA